MVFDKYNKIYRDKFNLTEHVVMENIFKCIDSSILFPNSEQFKNFKRKVTSKSKKNCSDTVEEFYLLKNDLGPNCAAIGLSISVFDKIVNGNYDYSTDQLKGKYISNNVALEIFRLNKKN